MVNFNSNILIFYNAMFSDGPRELQNRKSSSRAGVVTFFERRFFTGYRLSEVQAMFSDGPREFQDRKSSSRSGVLKSYEFIVKNRVWAAWTASKKNQIVNDLLLFKKHVLLQPMVLFQQKLDLWGLQIDFSVFLAHNLSVFFGPRFSALKWKSSKHLVKNMVFWWLGVLRYVEKLGFWS